MEIYEPLKHLTLDIETMNATPEGVDFEAQFLKAAANTKDPEKQAAQVATKRSKLTEKSALSPSAPIACVGLYAPELGEPKVIHWMPCSEPIDGVDHAKAGDNEREMLIALRELLNLWCDDATEIVGANVGFDLPKLRYAYARNGLKLPEILKPRSPNPVYDVLYIFGKYFLPGNGAEFNISLDECLKRLGILGEGKTVTGAAVPGMIERGEYRDVIEYNALDVVATDRAYLILTSQVGE
jgi:hypothetical protein